MFWLNVTATQKAARLAIVWLEPAKNRMANTSQWRSVLITPTEVYRTNSFSIRIARVTLGQVRSLFGQGF